MRFVILALLLPSGCWTKAQTIKTESAVCQGYRTDCAAANKLLEADGWIEKTSAACRWYEKECK